MRSLLYFLISWLFIFDKNARNALGGIRILANLDIDFVRVRQLARLRALASHAVEHVPYYAELAAKGVIDPDLKGGWDEYHGWPILNRETVRREGGRLHSDDKVDREYYSNASGGATGDPLVLIQDKGYRSEARAAWTYTRELRGLDPFGYHLLLWSATRDTFDGRKPLKRKLKDFLLNRFTINAAGMSEDDMRRAILKINSSKPPLIIAYADAVYELAEFALRQGFVIQPVKAIHTSASRLWPEMRQTIEDVFRCEVFDHYGCRELSGIATECIAHDGMHVMMNNHIVEVLDDLGQPCQPGITGEIVVTCLTNYAMPMIRYAVQDRGALKANESCSCGCTFEKLDSIEGRSLDYFIRRDGMKVYGTAFNRQMFHKPEIRAFEIVQKDYELILYRLAGERVALEKYRDELSQNTLAVMGKGCKVQFEFVDEIPRTTTGKYRHIRRNMTKDQQ